MKFGIVQKKRFEASDGSYSLVTEREEYDSQVTLTDHEATLVLNHFGQESIQVGNVSSNRERARKTFRLYPSGDPVQLNLVFPKPEKTELRLYLAKSKGFRPKGGHIWFMFLRGQDLWIGEMSEREWRSESSILNQDETDEDFQRAIYETGEIRVRQISARDVYTRDRRIAKERIRVSNYSCEFDANHQLFIARSTGKPYLEAHHLIPIGAQSQFDLSLDTLENVFCLCPNCHRAVHHAETAHVRQMLDSLLAARNVIAEFSLDVESLYALYGVENIIR